MPVTIFSSERTSQEEGVRSFRKEQLRELMSDLSALVINTGNKNKAWALADLINRLTGQPLVSRDLICFSDPNQEKCFTRAASVAQSKVDNLIKDLGNHPEHSHSINGETDQDLNLLFSQMVLFAGSDVNSFLEVGDGKLRQNHQLAREYGDNFPEEKFWQMREQLQKEFCFPESGKVVLRWDIASHLVNGRGHIFSDLIEVVSLPVNPQLLDRYLLEAWENNLILNSNQHFAALECLIENGKIISASHLPRELEEQGAQLADFATNDISPMMLSAFLYSVINNTPIYIP
jgi:hypothetical protein